MAYSIQNKARGGSADAAPAILKSMEIRDLAAASTHPPALPSMEDDYDPLDGEDDDDGTVVPHSAQQL